MLLVSNAMLADTKQDVLSATKKLSEAGGYSWKAERSGSQFWSGVVNGQVRKDGGILVEQPGREGTFKMAVLGKNLPPKPKMDGKQPLS